MRGKESLLGEVLRTRIKAMGLRQYEAAELMGMHWGKLNRIVNGKQPITGRDALVFENHLGDPARIWLYRHAEQLLMEAMNEDANVPAGNEQLVSGK